MKISTEVKLAVLILLVFALLSGLSVFFWLGKMSDDGNIVNNSGRQRAISQRLTKMVYAKQHGSDVGDNIVQLTGKMDKIVAGLLNGDAELRLPKAGDEKLIAKMNEINTEWQKYKDAMSKAETSPEALNALYIESEKLLKLADESTTLAAELSEGKVRALKTIQIVLFVLNFLILVAILFVSQKKVIRPLSVFKDKVNIIANGDLRVVIDYDSKDEIGALSRDMNKMIGIISEMISGIMGSAGNVVHTVDVLRVRSEKTTEGARNQSGQANQIATAAEEMSQTITDISRNAAEASQSSEDAMKTANDGKVVADGAVDTVAKVYTSTIELSTMVEKLNKRASEIGGIVTVIKDIADQTNLLALNAAIEAARAGEQGRGFAVVADEVRKLAERTIKATGEITEKINAVQTESEQTSKSMEDASGEVTKATDYIRQVGDSLNHIVDAVQKVRDQITQIATAVDEQSAVSEEVASNIEKTSNIARDMEKMSDEVMHEVNGLIKIAEELRNTTSGFKTKGSELMILDIAKTDHRVFVGKVGSCLKGDTTLDPAKLPDHHTCRFGKWYDTEGREKCGNLPSFKAILTPHDRIHALAKEAIAAFNSGNKEKATGLYNEMEDLSEQIVSLLDGVKRECK
ncbi:MAG: CZB domain-containing protein [Nitrospirae bacterium]|nr:CZB domain-containing protein [Nitrospirota bacterium]